MICISDIETDGFDPTVIHCVGIMDYSTGEYYDFAEERVPEGLYVLSQAQLVIGHNFRVYDARHINRLTGGLVSLKSIYDTYDASRRFFPKMKKHSLEVWGDILGFPKMPMYDFSKYSPEMSLRCEIDVRLNAFVFNILNQLEGGSSTLCLPRGIPDNEASRNATTLLEGYLDLDC